MSAPIVFADHCGQRAPTVHNCRPQDAPLVFTRETTYRHPDEWECRCGRRWRRNPRHRAGFDLVAAEDVDLAPAGATRLPDLPGTLPDVPGFDAARFAEVVIESEDVDRG